MVIAAAGIGPNDTSELARQRLLQCVGEADVAGRLASATGLGETQFPLHEINWATRKFLQKLAEGGPVLAMFDDVHWAEPAFLDLIGNLLETVENAQVLLVATARHDLLEERAQWSQSERAARLVLQPLGPAALAQVAANLLGSSGLGENLIKRIVGAAEGNPLYVEQMLSMLKDSGALRQAPDGGWVVAGGRGRHCGAAPRCNGGGQVIGDPCGTCRGQGRIRKQTTLSVKIPPGVDTGDRIRLAGEGEAGRSGGPSGDLYVEVRVRDHSIFERDGSHLSCEVPVSFATAALGGSIEVPTLDGNATIKIPPETQFGRVFRLREKGIKPVRGGPTGDLFCRIVVETPVHLTREQKDLR